MRRRTAVAAGIGLLALAFGVGFSTPSDQLIEAAFPETGALGEAVVSEHLVVTVHSLALADEVDLDGWRGTTAGVWLVVDATIAARTERMGVQADVFAGDTRYPSTGRVGIDVLDGQVADAGMPLRGAILVELPTDLVERGGDVVLRIGPGLDVRLDSVVEYRIDLGSLDHDSRVELETPEVPA